MALHGQGFSLRSLLENPSLQNPPNLNKDSVNLKKNGKLGGYTPNLNSAFLGSNLWDKPISNDNSNSNDFDLEYMDLDEFLSENGIPVNPSENDDSQTISLLASALARSPPRSPNPGSPGLLINPMSPGSEPDKLDKMVSGFPNLGSPLRQPSSPLGPVTMSPKSVGSPCASPSVIERYLMDDNFGIKMPATPPSPLEEPSNVPEPSGKRKMAEAEFIVKPNDMSTVSIPVYHQNGSPIPSVHSVPSPHCWENNYDSDDGQTNNDGEHLVNSQVPGQDGFDPTSRKFSTEELKPQPIIKKAKKVFVDDTAKDDKYWQRRKKNNVAAKRSREARRVKENQIAMRAAFLEEENEKLRVKFSNIQRENEKLLKRLAKYEKIE